MVDTTEPLVVPPRVAQCRILFAQVGGHRIVLDAVSSDGTPFSLRAYLPLSAWACAAFMALEHWSEYGAVVEMSYCRRRGALQVVLVSGETRMVFDLAGASRSSAPNSY